ncbi:MAG: signal peptide peptidase SppA [Candidatus Lernaella stagnicola]|nr:signal peptide peptidase SppA [Candidatus Lernaella stagnicola]
MKRYPFLLGFLIFGLVAVLFYAVVVFSFSFAGTGRSFGVSWFSESIGVVEIVGVIDSSRRITEQIRDYAEDSGIAGLLVRIDSPGGVVAPTQEIYSELRRTSAETGIPIVASLGSTAASGGYYVAAGCDYVVANPGTLTGSIGVIMEFITVEGAFEKLGLKSEVIKSGPFKDSGNYARSLTPAEREMLQSTIDSVHEQFVEAVAAGRGLEPERVREIADGRIYSGAQAIEIGLVDQLGTFYDAVDVLKEKLDITGKVKLIFPKRKKPDLMDLFLDDVFGRLEQWPGTTPKSRLYYR